MRKLLIGLLGYTFVSQQMAAQTDSVADTRELKAVVVKATNGIKSRFRVDNAEIIGQGQLVRAACCNLGESFTANPSVDVSYSDAATGAKQIKLLGLSGTYVQMLTENIPNLRGASLPYSLGYVPGPWMQSIQVSKGASSVYRNAWCALGSFQPLRQFLHATSAHQVLSIQYGHATHFDRQGLSFASCFGRERVAIGKRQTDYHRF